MYDAATETLVADYSARSGSPITSLTSDQVAGHNFVAGFGDGAVRVYDTRMDSRNPLVRAWKQHKSWIVNVHMQRGGIRELVTGSIAGEVRLFEYPRTQTNTLSNLVVYNMTNLSGRFRLIRLRCDVLQSMNMLLFSRLGQRVRVSKFGIWMEHIYLRRVIKPDFFIKDARRGLRD
jgi:hypothetical protein